MSKKILALAAEPVSGEALEQALGDEEAQEAEVLFVVPALNSRLRFWVSDADPAIERAKRVAAEAVEQLESEGVEAAGDTGEPDPLLAIQDALTTFEADEILLFRTEHDDGWIEEGVAAEARERFGRPVRELRAGA